MTCLNPTGNCDTIPICFPSKLTKQVPKILVYLRSPAPFDSAVPASAHPPHFECTPLLLRSTGSWRHNIILSIARTILMLSECKLSTDNYVDYQNAYYTNWLITKLLTMKIALICLLTACKRRKFKLSGDCSQVRALDNGITCCYWSASLRNRLCALKKYTGGWFDKDIVLPV